MTLVEVIAGVKKGLSYRREVSGIVDTLSPLGNGRVIHSVYNERTGSGGEAEIKISDLRNGRWPVNHWELH